MKVRAHLADAFAMLQKIEGSAADGVEFSRGSAKFRTAMQDVMGDAANVGCGSTSLARAIPKIVTWPVQHGEHGGTEDTPALKAGTGAPAPLMTTASPVSAEAGVQTGTLAEPAQANESHLLDRRLGQADFGDRTSSCPSLYQAGGAAGQELQPAMAEDASLASAKNNGGIASGSERKGAAEKDASRKTEEGRRSAESGKTVQHAAATGTAEIALVHPPSLPMNMAPIASGGVVNTMVAAEIAGTGQRQPIVPAKGTSQARPAPGTSSSLLSQVNAVPGGAVQAANVNSPGVTSTTLEKTQPLIPEKEDVSSEIQGPGVQQSQNAHLISSNAMPVQAAHAAVNASEKENTADKSGTRALFAGGSIALQSGELHTAVQHGSAQHESGQFGSAQASTTGIAGGERVQVEHRSESAVPRNNATAGATQVLSRMDTAPLPTSLVALRADTRHLDVGIASSALGWVEIRASTSVSGGINAALHVQTDATAHALAGQAKEIVDYARQHAAPLGQLSVDVGAGGGGSARREFAGRDLSAREQGGRETGADAFAVENVSPMYGNAGAVSLISLRA